MARSAKPRKRKPSPQRSKLPRYVVTLHDDDFFDEEDAEVLRFDSFDDAVECCADLNIPLFVDVGNKKLVFWFVRVDDEGYPEIARCTEREFATILAGISAGVNATMFDRYLPFSCPLNTFVTDAVRFPPFHHH